VHHVAEEFARRVANLVVQLVCAFLVDVKDALVPLKKGQGAIMLQVEIKSTNYLLLQVYELLACHLLTQEGWETLDHHLEARIHMLVHLGSHEDRARC
jgi:hypothetical protein